MTRKVPSFLTVMTQAPSHRWSLRRAADGQLFAVTLIPAFDRKTRNKGLLGRGSLEPGTAIILAPCSGVHTFFMKFAIDIAFIDRDGWVLKVRHRCQPWRLSLGVGAFAVIELPAGALHVSGMNIGDRLEVFAGGDIRESVS